MGNVQFSNYPGTWQFRRIYKFGGSVRLWQKRVSIYYSDKAAASFVVGGYIMSSRGKTPSNSLDVNCRNSVSSLSVCPLVFIEFASFTRQWYFSRLAKWKWRCDSVLHDKGPLDRPVNMWGIIHESAIWGAHDWQLRWRIVTLSKNTACRINMDMYPRTQFDLITVS